MPNSVKTPSSLNAIGTFLRVGSCSETGCSVVNRAFGYPLTREEHAAMPLAGGVMQHGYQCGLLWGTALAAGAEAYRRFGSGVKAEAAAGFASQRIIASFHERYREINCLELIDTDWTNKKQIRRYMLKGGPIRCFGMAGRFSPNAAHIVEEALAQESFPVPDAPVSCAAELARKLGATEQQVVMAAGLAGGIGLSGSGCGVLGAAVWLLALKLQEGTEGKVDYTDPRIQELIEQFLAYADYRFQCDEIVGRKFEHATDHAAHLQEGGCREIIEGIARHLDEA